MSDFLWYSRLLVWVGCGGLLIEAVTGRSFGYLTVVAVIFLVVGFCGFLGALMLEDRSMTWLSVLAEESAATDAPAHGTTIVSAQEREAPFVEGRTRPADVAGTPIAAPTQVLEPESRPVTTQALTSDSLPVGHRCPQCGKILEAGQVVAICWSCDTPHHLACWQENQSHCATPGCAGAGSLDDSPLLPEPQ